MALDYGSVKDMYDTLYSSGVTTKTLPEWSTEMNDLTGTNLYAAGLHDNWIKRASHGIDKLLESTGLPGYGETAGRAVGNLVGAPEAGAELGRGLPRATLNFAPLLIPGGGWAGAAAKAGLTGVLTGAETYEKTDSPLASLISGATATALPGIASKTAEATGQVLSKLIGVPSIQGPIADLEGNIVRNISERIPQTFGQKAIVRGGSELAGQAAAAAMVGASQPLEQLAQGQEPTSPFTVENLLGLTLGQAPFAAIHLGGRLINPPESPVLKAKNLQGIIELSKIRIALKDAAQVKENQTPVEQLPVIEAKPLNPETIAATELLLSQVRGEQIDVKKRTDLTDEQKLDELNKLMDREHNLLKEKNVVTGDTVFGNKSTPDQPRQEVIGNQLFSNKNGTWRAVHVADDPANPEDLRGKVIGYSTLHEPAPQRIAPETTIAKYSLPDAQWRNVKTFDEWNARFRKNDAGQPELPAQGAPMSQEELSSYLHELDNVEASVDGADTPGDLQKSVVDLQAVQHQNELTPTTDAKLAKTTKRLADSGVKPDVAIKTAVKVETKRTARKIQASTRELERATPELTPEEAADISARMGGQGFSVMTADKLSHTTTDEDLGVKPVADIVTDAAMPTAKSPVAQDLFNKWEGREDTTYAKDFQDYIDLVENYGSLSKVPLEEAGKVLAERTGAVPWDAAEVSEFINRPHVQEWGKELDNQLAQQQVKNVVPAPVMNIAGRKGQLLKNEEVGNVIKDFSQGHDVVDAFGGAGELSEFAKSFGAKSITTNIKNPQMFAIWDEIKNNSVDFAERVKKAVAPITSNREQSVPTVEGYDNIRTYLDELTKTDPNVALYIKQNLNAMGREVAGGSFTPSKVIATEGLQSLPSRISSYARTIDKISNEDGWDIVAKASEGDKIMVDPPYAGTKKGMYADVGNVTTEQQLQNYEKYLYPAAERGAQFVVFDIADPQLISSLESHGFTVQEAQRTSRGGGTVKPELVATNSPDVVRAPGTTFKTTGQEPLWQPIEPRDVDKMNEMGLAQGGQGMLNYLSQSKNPFFVGLAKDLAKFGDSLARVSGAVRDIDFGAYLKRLPEQNYEVSLSPSILRMTPGEQEYAVAHELVHGLTLAELEHPTNARFIPMFDDLRDKVVNSLPKNMRKAYDNAIESDWYRKWGSGEVDYSSLMRLGSDKQRNILYGLLDPREFVAQGLSEKPFREFLQSIKTGPEGWYHQFTNLVRTMLGLGEKITNTAFEEFLSKTDQLLQRGNYVSSFRNFSDRYFENLGMSKTYVDSGTQRAMGLILGASKFTTVDDALALYRHSGGIIRTAEWAKAQRDVTRMFSERGDDLVVTQNLLDETGHQSNVSGLLDFTDSLIRGEVGHDSLDLLPEPAIRYVLETAKDAQNIFGAIRSATLEQNKGVLNIAEPDFVHSVAKQTLKGIEKVVVQERVHDMQVRDIQNLFNVPPDGFYSNVIRSPEVLPEWAHGDTKKSWFDSVARFLEPIGQTARRIPEAAEAYSRGWELRANVRNMARESLKALGMDLSTMQLTPKTVKDAFRVFTNPTLRKAADKWIATNNIEGEKSEKGVSVIDADDARIQKIIGGLSPTDREIVEDMVNKHSISTQHMQEQVLEKGLQTASTDGGALLQKLAGGKLKDSVDTAGTLLRAFTSDRSDPNAASVADAQIQKVQSGLDPDTFLTIARFTKAAADRWIAQKEGFDKNPGWSTAQRFGKYLVEYRKGGKSFLQGVDSKKEAEALTEGRPYKLSPNKQYDEDRPPGLGFNAQAIADRIRGYDQNMIDILQNTGTYTPDQIAQIKQYSGGEQFLTEEAYRGGVQGLSPQPRRLTKGAEELPWLRNHVSWIHQTSNAWSRQLLKAQARAHLSDPEISSNEQLHANLQTHYENMLQPDTAVGRFFQRAAMTWFMGFNPASTMMNATQPFVTHVAEFTNMTGKPLESYRRMTSALKEIVMSGLGHKEWKNPETAKFMERFIRDGEADISMFDDQAAGQELLHTNLVRMLNGDKPQTLGQKLSTMAGNISTVSMWMFKTAERVNAMAAGIAANHYYRESEPNLSPDEIYAKAVNFHHAVNFGGGAAARPVGAFSGRGVFPRTTAMLATAMQSYNLGTMFQIARYIRSGFFRPEGLTPHEVYSARKAAVQMLGTQLAAAGVLGLPFVSGMLSVLNQAFPDLEVNRKLRESMNTLLGEDADSGHVLTDMSMTGVPSMMGWDLQSRLSMGNTVPGVSEINGFQPENLLGAPANLVSSFLSGSYKLASGDPHAVDAFMPSALKKLEQLLRSGGQVLDYRNRPIFTPTLGEKVGIALGFNPKRLSDYNVAARVASQTDDNIKRREGQFHQELASEVLRGNFGTVRQALLQRTREDSKYDPIQAVRSISSAAEELTFPRDLRREGTIRSGDVRGQLLSTFNLPSTQPSEVDRARFRQSVQQRLGLMTTSPTDLSTAQLVDQLRSKNPTASRSELRQQASLLLHGQRRSNFSLQQE